MRTIYLISKIAGRLKLSGLFSHIITRIIPPGREKLIEAGDELARLEEEWPDKGKSCLCENNVAENPEYDIQVIIAAYNSASTIEECVESVLNQNSNAKILLTIVDDGSTDATGRLIDNYGSHPDVEIIHQENRGHSGARNTALRILRGRYLTFVDADDMLPPDALDTLYQAAVSLGSDIVQGSYQTIDMEGRVLRRHILPQRTADGKMLGYPWGKLYRSSLFSHIQFPEGYWFEDTLMAIMLFCVIDKSRQVSISKIVYNYRVNPVGVTATASKSRKVVDSLWVTRRLYADREKIGSPLSGNDYPQFLRQCAINLKRVDSYGDPRLTELVFDIQRSLRQQFFLPVPEIPSELKPVHAYLQAGNLEGFRIITSFIRKN
ncbi:MAG: glycosyltransferase [Muribaculaceae bacterium]|nr:glycosyltransferase [Muribaculaceae bacterium]